MDEAIEEAQDGVSASRMLDEIEQAVEQVGLVGELAAGTKLFRGRVRPKSLSRKLGPLPEGRTVANRMGLTGIPRQSHTRRSRSHIPSCPRLSASNKPGHVFLPGVPDLLE